MRRALVLLILLCACGDDDGGGGGGGGADARPAADGATGDPDAGGNPFTLTTFIGAEQAPLVWVAAQDGDQPWVLITSRDGVYEIDLDSDRFGIAYVCEVEATRYFLSFFHATTGEVSTLARACPGVAAPTGDLSFQVTGLDDNGAASVSFGNGGGVATMADDTVDIPLTVGEWEFVTTVKPNNTTINRVAITTGSIIQGETTSLQLGATADTVPVVNFEATVTGVDPGSALVDAYFLSARGTRASMTQPGEFDYATVPAGSLREGDLHLVSATAVLDNVIRTTGTYIHEGEDVSLEMPEGFAPDLVAAATEPYVRLEATWDDWPGAEVYFLDARQGFETTTRRVQWLATADWLSGGEGGAWTQPDLSGTAGWNDEWGMDPAQQVLWTLHASKASGDRFAFDYFEFRAAPFDQPDWEGAVVTRSSRSGFFSP